MSVSALHPLYGVFLPDWIQMRDGYLGQRRIKEKGALYLQPTSGMVDDGMQTEKATGTQAYLAYRQRAVYPGLPKAAVESMLGVMHARPPIIELPDSMEELREKATLKNENLEMLLRRINEEQLITGRVGMLLEVPPGANAKMPFVALYTAERIINWDEGTRTGDTRESLNFVALDETEQERQKDFEWKEVKKYRILVLGDVESNEPQGEGIYRVGLFSEDESRDTLAGGSTFTEENLVEPSIKGTKMTRIPFVFVNTKDINPDPDVPPLLDLSDLALTIYRGEADYRQALFMQGQDTLVVSGHVSEDSNHQHRIGAGASIDLPPGGDAKFIGTDSTGLPEMRTAIENDHIRAGRKAGELIDETARGRESGEALKVRVAARTATLNQIALAGAFALQELLRMAAEWIGADPAQVIVTPNTDFVDDRMLAAELAGLIAAKTMGAPISIETIHKNMEDRNLTEMTFEEEIKALEDEEAIEILQPAESTDDDGPEADDDGGDGDE